jgi:hypothetical protein
MEDGEKLGRKYLETVIGETPILSIIPGKPSFLIDFKKEQKGLVADLFSDVKKDKAKKDFVEKFFGIDDMKYFEFLSDYSNYQRYANMLCRVSSMYLGIGELKAPNSNNTYLEYDWSNYRFSNTQIPNGGKGIDKRTDDGIFTFKELKADIYEAIFGGEQYKLRFYIDSSSGFSESTSNSTATSYLEGAFEKGEGFMKELAFFINSTGMEAGDNLKKGVGNVLESSSDALKTIGGPGLFSTLLGNAAVVVTGSNIEFPEIWQDANYNKSYNVTLNLFSPYGDKESIYLNILVPMMHVLALALPRQTTANSYSSPFLIRATAKGWFSCEMGVIENLTIEKDPDSWTIDGLPTKVKISFSIKDLYSSLSIPSTTQPFLFYQNVGLQHFLEVTCGLDVAAPDHKRKIETLKNVIFNVGKDVIANKYDQYLNAIRNKTEQFFRL